MKERYEKKRNTRGVIWPSRFFYSICYELEKKQKDYLIVRLNLIQWKCVSRHGRFVNFFGSVRGRELSAETIFAFSRVVG